MAPHCRSLLHTEQAFAWQRPLAVGEALLVRGAVAAVRSRGPLHLVSFEVAAAGAGGRWMAGSVRLPALGRGGRGERRASGAVPGERAARGDPALPGPLPASGRRIPPLRRSASRGDLVRYAAATGDANPIHRDHAAARAAGLPGVVAHGLLLAAWFFQAAARFRAGPHPLQSARVRFRRPLRPGGRRGRRHRAGGRGGRRPAPTWNWPWAPGGRRPLWPRPPVRVTP